MSTQVIIGVYRRLDNRLEGLPDDSPRALELHNRRKAALHSVLDSEKVVEVLDWGKTDDAQSHELVEITIGALASTAFTYLCSGPWFEIRCQEIGRRSCGPSLFRVGKVVDFKVKAKARIERDSRFPDQIAEWNADSL